MSLVVMDGFDWLASFSGFNTSGGFGSPKWTVIQGAFGGAQFHVNNGSATTNLLLSHTFPVSKQHATVIVGMSINLLGTLNPITFLSVGSVFFNRYSDGRLEAVGPGGSLGITVPGIFGSGDYFECKVTADSSTGSVIVKLNGTIVLNLTNKNTGTAPISSLSVAIDNFSFGGSGSLDDIYVLNGAGSAPLNDFLGQCKVKTYIPNADGTFSQWNGSDGNSVNNYLLVNDIETAVTIDDGNTVSASTVGIRDTYNFSDSSGTVVAAQAFGRFRVSDNVQVKAISIVHRDSGGTTTVSTSTNIPQDGSVVTIAEQYDTQASGAAWTTVAFNATEFGFEVAT